MNYPATQFEVLKNGIEQLSRHFEVKQMNPSNLHFLVYQQASEGQTHNWLYINNEGTICRRHKIDVSELPQYTKLINIPADFQIYPDSCNDNHIETAVKKIQKML